MEDRRATHNLLVVGYLQHGVVVPLAWRALGKRGSSHQTERIALLTALFERSPPERVAALLGDREFIGKDFLGWLDRRGVCFVIRARKNAWLECVGSGVASGVAYQAAPLFALLRDGGRRRLRGKWQVYGTACFVTATRRDGSVWVLISNRCPNRAEVLYRQRWQIETMFGVLKGRGFDLEATHLAAPERIERLFGVLAVALVWVLSVGRWRVLVRPARRASHGRPRRSLFRTGLDGLTRLLVHGESRQLRRTFQVLSCT
ncbi:MAG: transposase [Bacteroidota bacterium]